MIALGKFTEFDRICYRAVTQVFYFGCARLKAECFTRLADQRFARHAELRACKEDRSAGGFFYRHLIRISVTHASVSFRYPPRRCGVFPYELSVAVRRLVQSYVLNGYGVLQQLDQVIHALLDGRRLTLDPACFTQSVGKKIDA